MSLDTIMNLQITVESRALSTESFGTPMLVGYHTAWIDRLVTEYAQADDMLDDGFTADDALYKAAQIVKSQNPCPSTFKVGRRVVPLTQKVELGVLNTTAGFKYKGTIGGKALVYTVLPAATPTTVALALATAITALAAGAAAAALVGIVTVMTTAPGTVLDFDIPERGLSIKDVTVDTTTDNELPDINEEDNKWYGLLVVDSSSKATALHIAGWTEAHRKIATIQSADTEVLDATVLDDTFSALKGSSYARTNAIYHRAIGGVEWLAAGWQADALTRDPGRATWAFKIVHGVKFDKLNQGQETALQGKFASHYTEVGGTFEGHSGSGEYMDTIRFIDWVYSTMRSTVLGLFENNQKIPFTDTGVDLLRSAIMTVIQQGIDVGGFSATPKPSVDAPLVKTIAAVDRINRTLPNVSWTANLAGAIHRMTPVRGRVTV